MKSKLEFGSDSFVWPIIDNREKTIVATSLVEDALDTPIKTNRVIPFEGQVFATTNSQNYLYEIQAENINRLGNPLGLGINSIKRMNNEIYLGASGRYVLKWDPNQEINFQKSETFFWKRDNPDFNPMVVERKPSGYAKLITENDVLKTLTKEDLQLDSRDWDENFKIQFEARNIYLIDKATGERTHLLKFRGKFKKFFWKTPSGKMLLVNEGKLQLLDPLQKTVQALHQFNMEQYKSFRHLVVNDSELYFTDRDHQLYLVKVPKHMLIL